MVADQLNTSPIELKVDPRICNREHQNLSLGWSYTRTNRHDAKKYIWYFLRVLNV